MSIKVSLTPTLSKYLNAPQEIEPNKIIYEIQSNFNTKTRTIQFFFYT